MPDVSKDVPSPDPMECPACGAMMYPARLLEGYAKTGPEAERITCALHGPLGRFRHIGTDRDEKEARRGF